MTQILDIFSKFIPILQMEQNVSLLLRFCPRSGVTEYMRIKKLEQKYSTKKLTCDHFNTETFFYTLYPQKDINFSRNGGNRSAWETEL